MTMIRLLVSF